LDQGPLFLRLDGASSVSWACCERTIEPINQPSRDPEQGLRPQAEPTLPAFYANGRRGFALPRAPRPAPGVERRQ
jgi:hypothetical protein